MAQPDPSFDLLQHNPLWKQIFEQNAAVQLLVDPARRLIVDANAAASRFYGYPRAEMQGLSLNAIEAPGPQRRSDDPTSIFDFEHRLRDGQIRQVKVTASVVTPGSAFPLMHLIIFDITKRRRAEAAAVGQRELASALVNTAAALVDTLDLPEVLDRILTQVQLLFPTDYINIMLIEGEYASVVRARGYERITDLHDYSELSLDVYETPTLRWMMEHRQPLLIADVENDSRWTPTVNTIPWLKCYLGAPIRMGGIVIGFLNFDSGRVGRFLDYDKAALQAFADQAGSAIRNARLFERVRRQASTMEMQVVERSEQLDYERKLFRTILDSMAEALIYSEIEDGVLMTRYLNPMMMRMMGFPEAAMQSDEARHEAIARISAFDLPRLDRNAVERETLLRLRAGQTFIMRTHIEGSDGIQTELEVTTSPVFDSEGTLNGAVTVVRDVSQAAALERQRSRFLARASHELRTPITNLKTRLYLLRRQPARLAQDLPVLEQVTTQMGHLVETLLEMSRLERGNVQLRRSIFTANSLVRDVIAAHTPTIEARNQHLIADITAVDLPIYADADRLTQVLNNLISNASAYSPVGASITVSLTETNDQPSTVCFAVIDTGIGIPLDQQEDIFKPFYRVVDDGEGSGLGLSIAREIVELHGGTISVQSAPGLGSTFVFNLPIARSAGDSLTAP